MPNDYEQYNPNTQIIRTYLVRRLEDGTFAILCPLCHKDTIWVPPHEMPKRCFDCGRRLTVRFERRSYEECLSTESAAASAATPKSQPSSHSMNGSEKSEPAPSADAPSGKSSPSQQTSSSEEGGGRPGSIEENDNGRAD